MKEKVSNIRSLGARRRNLRAFSSPQEVILWSRLRNKQLEYKFRRQHSLGRYIADFYCPDKKLIIEVDGSQHVDQEKYDTKRTGFFQSKGLKVVRFWNSDINTNLDSVVSKIVEMLNR